MSQFQRAALANFFVIFLFPLAGAFLAVIARNLLLDARPSFESPAFWVGIFTMIAGYLVLVWSKWDQIRRGDYFKWGVTDKSRFEWYLASYAMMIVGFVLAAYY